MRRVILEDAVKQLQTIKAQVDADLAADPYYADQQQ
jgi:hypothetical protein